MLQTSLGNDEYYIIKTTKMESVIGITIVSLSVEHLEITDKGINVKIYYKKVVIKGKYMGYFIAFLFMAFIFT